MFSFTLLQLYREQSELSEALSERVARTACASPLINHTATKSYESPNSLF